MELQPNGCYSHGGVLPCKIYLLVHRCDRPVSSCKNNLSQSLGHRCWRFCSSWSVSCGDQPLGWCLVTFGGSYDTSTLLMNSINAILFFIFHGTCSFNLLVAGWWLAVFVITCLLDKWPCSTLSRFPGTELVLYQYAYNFYCQ